LALEDRHKEWKESTDQRGGDEGRTAMYALAATYEKDDERQREQHVEGRHRVVRAAVIEESDWRDQERVVGRVEIWQYNELIWRMVNDLQLVLLLQGEVINGGATLEDI